jgi:hypothetical protein
VILGVLNDNVSTAEVGMNFKEAQTVMWIEVAQDQNQY